jgi:ADP-heptose:LPS heptosyltransferase
VRDDIHEVERALSLAGAAGYSLPDSASDALQLEYTRAHVDLPWNGAPYIVVHPGADAPARAWDPRSYRELTERLVANGWGVAVTGTRDEATLTQYVAGSSDRTCDLGGKTDFAALATVLADAHVLVAGNTGPAHVATAVGTPVISLYAPTVPAVRWRPWRVSHVLLGRQHIACAGCRARVCPVPGHPCLDVPPARVVEALDEVVARGVPIGALS